MIALEEAIAKMTSRSAAMLGLADRRHPAGKRADVVIFDAATIADRGTPQEPAQAPVGVDTVIVNGQVVLDRGEVTSARPGRALRRTGARPR